MKEAPIPSVRSAGQAKIRSLESAIGPKLVVKSHEVGERAHPKAAPKAKFTEVIIGPKLSVKHAKPATIFTTERVRPTSKIGLNKEAMKPKNQFNLPRKEGNPLIRLQKTPQKEKVQYINRQQLLHTLPIEQKDLGEKKKNEKNKEQEIKIDETKKYKSMSEGRKRNKKRRRHRRRAEAYARKASKKTEALLPVHAKREESREMKNRTTETVTSPVKTEQPQAKNQLIVKKAAADIRQIEATYKALKTLAKSGKVSSQTYGQLRESILIKLEDTAKTVKKVKESNITKKSEPVEIPDNIIKEMQLKDLITSLTATPKPLLKQTLTLLLQLISSEQTTSIKQKLMEEGHSDIIQVLEREMSTNLDNSGEPPIDIDTKEKVRKDEKPDPKVQDERIGKDQEKRREQNASSEKGKRSYRFQIKSIIPRMMWFIQNQESVNQKRKKVMLEKYKQKKQEGLNHIVGKDLEPPVPSPIEISSQINPRNDGSIIAIASTLESYGRIESEQEAEHLANRMVTIFPAGEISPRPTDRILTNQEIAIIRNREAVAQAA
jgi:hypothetical protein